MRILFRCFIRVGFSLRFRFRVRCSFFIIWWLFCGVLGGGRGIGRFLGGFLRGIWSLILVIGRFLLMST
jgi:hypothetical protein